MFHITFLPIRKFLLSWIVLFSFLSLLFTSSSITFAASQSNDPLVVVEATATGPCTEIFESNLGTPYASVTRIPCPVGTIRHAQTIHLSLALMQHKAYVILPSLYAPISEKRQDWQQFQKLVLNEKKAQQRYLAQTAAHPATRCGNTGSAALNWSAQGTGFWGKITFYKTTDCSSISFDTATLKETTSDTTGFGWYWPFDKYASSTYNVPNCPNLTYASGRTASHGIGAVDVTGYTYENWILDGNCDTWLFPGYWWEDIPVN